MHTFALRMVDMQHNMPMEKLFLYETENNYLTIDDFDRINDNNHGYKLLFPVYCAPVSVSEYVKNQKSRFNILDVNS